jgi:hypothetical protein
MPPQAGRSALARVLIKYPLFVLMALAAGGFAAWSWLRPSGLPLFGPPTEAHRPALKADLSKVLKRFFTNPTYPHRESAEAIARQYRRSFPDATRDDDLMDPAETILCNVPLECAPREREQEQRRAALQEAIERQAAHLPRGSPDQRAAIAEAYVLERRLPLSAVNKMIAHYYERSPGEAELLALQKDFFRIIDETVVPQNLFMGSASDQLLEQYLNKYYALAARSLNSVPWSCNRHQYRTRTDLHGLPPCERAAREYETVLTRQKDEFRAILQSIPNVGRLRRPEYRSLTEALTSERARALKKLIAERDADSSFMTQALKKMHLYE